MHDNADNHQQCGLCVPRKLMVEPLVVRIIMA